MTFRAAAVSHFVMAVALAVPGLAQAQASDDTSGAESGGAEIVVTAQRREERLVDVPLSVSAIGEAKLERAGATTVADIGTVVPNVQINETVGAVWSPLISIRGLAPSSDTSLGRDQPVGIYIDGVPISKSTGAAFDSVDLQRVEVLRGPQGTLYGKNTIGGAINLVTQKPTGEFGGKLVLGAGGHDLYSERLVVNLPRLGEGIGNIKIKLGAAAKQFGGFYDQLGTSRRFMKSDMAAGRADVVWEPVDGLSLGYAYDITDQIGNGVMLPISAPGLISPTGALSSLYPRIAGRIFTTRPKALATDYTGRSSFRVTGHAINLAYDVSEHLTVKSITAWRSLRTRSLSDFDGTPSDLLHFILNNDYRQFSEELQLLGTFDDFRFTLGGFYMKDRYDVDNPRWSLRLGNLSRFDVSQRSGRNNSKAAYGQLTYSPAALDHKLEVTVGGRWTKDSKRTTNLFLAYNTFAGIGTPNAAGPLGPQNALSGVFRRDPVTGMPITRSGGPALGALPGGAVGPSDLTPLTAAASWSKFTPEASISFKVMSDWNIYARYATGFKSGGYNDVAPSNASFLTPFDPENLKSYEIGTKGVFADGKFGINVALYHNIYTDFQAGVFVPALITTNVINADKARFQGIEIEGFVRPIRDLTFTYGFGHIDAGYKKFILPNGTDVTKTYSVPLVPKNNYQLGATWRLPLGDTLDLTTNLNYSWRSSQTSVIAPDPLTRRIAYGLLDGRITLGGIDLGSKVDLEFSIWGKNLADKQYWTSAINLGLFTVRQWGDPRQFGGELRLRF